MFPPLMTRCDLNSLIAPVTVTPNSSLVPGSPWSSTVTLKVQPSPPQVPLNCDHHDIVDRAIDVQAVYVIDIVEVAFRAARFISSSPI